MKTTLSLLQLNNLVRDALSMSMPGEYWVDAELSDCHESAGHCYMDLIQKEEGSNTPVARARACCWHSTWMKVRPRFERITGEPLHAGLKVLLRVRANFHEAYGFSWIVNDIDPNYTMGDMVRRRQEIIRTLQEEGVFDLNKSLTVPMFAKRIAVISSASAAGYGDFCNQLADNEYGFMFQTRLFQAVMQGEQVEESVIAALNAINDEIENFDVVVIIRGGGATSDMSGFDTLALAENVANFPIPVITGIGHERDESVLDIISCVRVKTPTAAAAFLIENMLSTYNRIVNAERRMIELVKGKMEMERIRLARIESFLPIAFSLKKSREENKLQMLAARLVNSLNQRIGVEKHKIDIIAERLPVLASGRIERERYRMEMLEHRTNAVNPVHILRRGYSIVLHDGVAVKDTEALKNGDVLDLILAKGVAQVEVKKMKVTKQQHNILQK